MVSIKSSNFQDQYEKSFACKDEGEKKSLNQSYNEFRNKLNKEIKGLRFSSKVKYELKVDKEKGSIEHLNKIVDENLKSDNSNVIITISPVWKRIKGKSTQTQKTVVEGDIADKNTSPLIKLFLSCYGANMEHAVAIYEKTNEDFPSIERIYEFANKSPKA